MENQLTAREVVALEFAKIFFAQALIRYPPDLLLEFAKMDREPGLTHTLLKCSFDFADDFLITSEKTQPNG